MADAVASHRELQIARIRKVGVDALISFIFPQKHEFSSEESTGCVNPIAAPLGVICSMSALRDTTAGVNRRQ
jgi:hypothetical protein